MSASAKKSYEIVIEFWHDGRPHAPGGTIMLTEAEAKYLVMGGTVRVPEVAAPQG